MLEQLLGALLFLFGFQLGGSVRGESTPSAVTASSSSILHNDIAGLEAKFLKNQKNALSNWEAKRASFSASLAIIKDEKKKTRMETLQNRLNEINKNQTTLYMGTLKLLNTGVEKIQEASQQHATESGKNTSDVTAKISSANTAIADAITIVTEQAQKTYVMTITAETQLKQDFGKERSKLASDLKKSRDAVGNARKKVGDALKALKNVAGKPIKILLTTEEAK